ncbi:MAG: hypothetical protein KDK48_03330, partial [Chlamydiia bacterium]|nr:hypothetical protein [Chlamydiia bacterium]
LFFTSLTFLITTGAGLSEKGDPLRLPLIFLLQAGVFLSLTTADFFNLFVAFGLMLNSSYALLALESAPEKRLSAFLYVILNVLGGFLFLSTAALVYGATGNLNMAALKLFFAALGPSPWIVALGLASITIYGLKAGLFPFYFWLPDSYPILPPSLAALFGGVLTKVGIYVLVRMFVTILPPELKALHTLLLALAGLTMLLGVLGAVSKSSVSKILSYHILSQVGYMALGLGLFTVPALAATLYFTVHNIVVKSSLFLIGGEAARARGSDELSSMGFLWGTAPLLGVFFLLQAFSLAGIPPLSGFWGKYLLFSETLASEHYLLLLIAVLTSFLTLFSMIKIWSGAFLGERCGENRPLSANSMGWIAVSISAALLLGLGAEGVWLFAEHAASELFDPAHYVEALLPGGGS